ncbi:hypothetical protein FN846DRAFT_922253 [Sphaerosporella brunnea]|uniref:Uncharacterized protein n=1 Tax=Sphaerosporella brunnea TaxID=1250544 RepID=A0A5J5EJF5_9PEZI|nr:hypothetical protein FN846DRAFT_922253 [Sphaerosporella brunnea]
MSTSKIIICEDNVNEHIGENHRADCLQVAYNLLSCRRINEKWSFYCNPNDEMEIVARLNDLLAKDIEFQPKGWFLTSLVQQIPKIKLSRPPSTPSHSEVWDMIRIGFVNDQNFLRKAAVTVFKSYMEKNPDALEKRWPTVNRIDRLEMCEALEEKIGLLEVITMHEAKDEYWLHEWFVHEAYRALRKKALDAARQISSSGRGGNVSSSGGTIEIERARPWEL